MGWRWRSDWPWSRVAVRQRRRLLLQRRKLLQLPGRHRLPRLHRPRQRLLWHHRRPLQSFRRRAPLLRQHLRLRLRHKLHPRRPRPHRKCNFIRCPARAKADMQRNRSRPRDLAAGSRARRRSKTMSGSGLSIRLRTECPRLAWTRTARRITSR